MQNTTDDGRVIKGNHIIVGYVWLLMLVLSPLCVVNDRRGWKP